jgi:hypothetical protein
MSNLVLDRINRQLSASTKKTEQQKEKVVVEEKKLPPPIPPSELKKIFMAELGNPIETPEKTMNFDGIQTFVNWYLPVQDKFTEQQTVALTTLVQARDMIFVGCNCKMKHRLEVAQAYYRNFWTENANNDLPSKIMEVGGFSSIQFAVDGHIFLFFPTPQ